MTSLLRELGQNLLGREQRIALGSCGERGSSQRLLAEVLCVRPPALNTAPNWVRNRWVQRERGEAVGDAEGGPPAVFRAPMYPRKAPLDAPAEPWVPLLGAFVIPGLLIVVPRSSVAKAVTKSLWPSLLHLHAPTLFHPIGRGKHLRDFFFCSLIARWGLRSDGMQPRLPGKEDLPQRTERRLGREVAAED